MFPDEDTAEAPGPEAEDVETNDIGELCVEDVESSATGCEEYSCIVEELDEGRLG